MDDAGGRVRRTYQVISCDGHLETPPDDWAPFVPEKYRADAPRMVTDENGVPCIAFRDMPLTPVGPEASCGDDPRVLRRTGNSYYEADGVTRRPGVGDAVQKLNEQDMDGIDAEFLYPPSFANRFLPRHPEREGYLSLLRAYNTWMAEGYCAIAPDRLIGIAMIPVCGIDDAIAEMKRCRKIGLRAVSLNHWPNGGGRNLPEDDRFFAACLDEDMRISPHIWIGDAIPSVTNAKETMAKRMGVTTFGDFSSGSLIEGPENPDRRFYGFKTPNRTAGNIVELALNGVFDRFPALKLHFAECRSGWVAEWLEHCMDIHLQTKYWYNVEIKRPLDEYVREHILFNFIRGYHDAHNLHLWGGEHNVTWGADMPHNASTFPFSREWIDRSFDGESPKLRRLILAENIARFMGFDLNAELTPTPPGGPYEHPTLAKWPGFRKDENGRYVAAEAASQGPMRAGAPQPA